MLVIDAVEATPTRAQRLVAMGASAGGLEALTQVLGAIGPGFGLPIVIVQHLAPHHVSRLVGLLDARTPLTVEQASSGALPEPGHVYVAPPDHHMIIDRGRLQLNQDAPVHFSRPSVDVLFDSVARWCAGGAIAVVLSGGGSDGTAGARAVRAAGGRVVVQDEESAVNFGMPGSVIAAHAADAVLTPRAIAAWLEDETRGG
jgi:chemotaxis response regulator CheB